MKRKIMLTLALCSLLATSKVQAQPVNAAFTDDNFYKCIIENYNREKGTQKTINDTLTNEELSSIKKLECADKSITNTQGLEKLTGLLKLNLENNDIQEINIDSNTELRYINIWNNPSDPAINITNNSNLKIILGKVDGTVDDSITNYFLTPPIHDLEKTLSVGEEFNSEYINGGQNIIYEVADTTIATIDSNNTIKALKVGRTLINEIRVFENLYPGFTGEEANEYVIVTTKILNVKNACPIKATGGRIYTVTFDTNGGKELENIETAIMLGTDLTEVKLELPTPTKEGYKFIGWYTDKDLKNKANIKSYGDIVDLENINEDECSTDLIVRLYAKWDKAVENPKTGVASYAVLGLIIIISLTGTYILYKNKENNI